MINDKKQNEKKRDKPKKALSINHIALSYQSSLEWLLDAISIKLKIFQFRRINYSFKI